MKTILITGASSGIGKATAQRFQAEGWAVIATMRDPSGSDLAGLDNVLVTRLDVTDPASITAAVSDGIDRFGAIDVLLNNAGHGAYGPLEAFSTDRIRRQFDTNVIGLLEVTKAVLPHMRAKRAGRPGAAPRSDGPARSPALPSARAAWRPAPGHGPLSVLRRPRPDRERSSRTLPCWRQSSRPGRAHAA